MNKLSKFTAIGLLILGGVLAIMAIINMKNRPTETISKVLPSVGQEKKISVVVAARNLPAGYLLQPEDVLMDVATKNMPENFTEAALVVGRTTAVEIVEKTPLTPASLIDGIGGLLAEGERAVSIKVDEASAVGHRIKPGDWVDVFLVMRRDGQEVDSTQARMLLPRKKVLVYGTRTQNGMQETDSKNKDAQTSVPRTAVIAVQVHEVNRLLLAEQQGQVLLALRNPLDQNEPSADMLKLTPGLKVASNVNQDVSVETLALDSSLLALKMTELASDASRGSSSNTKRNLTKAKSKSNLENSTNAVSVEVIRGSRKEIIRY